MKLMKRLFLLLLFILAATVGATAQDESTGPLTDKFPSIPGITLPSPISQTVADKSEPVEFPGGKILGHVRKETQGEKEIIVIDGDVGILLKKDNAGGVLRLDFANTPAEPVKAGFTEFPDGLHPQEAALDGRPVEVEISPGKGYLYMSLPEGKQIALSKVEFAEGASLSDPGAFDGIRIAIRPKLFPDAETLKKLLDFVKK